MVVANLLLVLSGLRWFVFVFYCFLFLCFRSDRKTLFETSGGGELFWFMLSTGVWLNFHLLSIFWSQIYTFLSTSERHAPLNRDNCCPIHQWPTQGHHVPESLLFRLCKVALEDYGVWFAAGWFWGWHMFYTCCFPKKTTHAANLSWVFLFCYVCVFTLFLRSQSVCILLNFTGIFVG